MRRISDKRKKKLENLKRKTQKLHEFYLEIWQERKHYSEVSGKFLGKEALTVFFHHILNKEKFPDLVFDKRNIILLTFEEHQKVEQDPTFFNQINEKRHELLSNL